MQPAFVHLRLHTEFSLVDGIVKIKPLVKRLAELNMPAVAVTEHANLFSLVKFYKAALGQGIKAIAGSDVLVFNPEDPATPYRLTLLVNNHAGYITLTELISKAYQEGQHQGVPMLRQEWIEANHNGLIALSGAMSGCIGKALLAENHDAAKRLAEFWGGLFEQSFYLELQRVGKPEEERYIAAAVELAVATGLPVVATNDVRFVYQQDFAAHEVRVCINQSRVLDDTRRPKDYTDQQYLRSVEEMQTLFADLPEALENTIEIAKRCNLKLTLGQNFLPDFPVPEGMNLGEFMADESMKGLEERLLHYPAVGKGSDEENRRVYYDRLDFELKMITQMGFPGYFMIVADFIQWAKNNLIPVGPGRGSGAGSLVAYALKITDLDPIEFDLLFERFLNPERVSMPDFDVDFCMDRRDEVIDYVARHYGRDHVAQIITYGSMAAKAVIRDVGRVLGFGYGFVDRLSKLVPFEIGMTLTKALKDSPELKQLYDTEEEVKALIDMALSLEGTSRNAGKHAGGVVISPTKLTDFTPLYCDQDGNNLVTQFDKDDVEAVGLVKFDFLGLRTLTIIDWALQDINAKHKQQGKALVDITTIPRDDPASYKLLTNAQTTAVFQLESRGMKELIKKLKPDCFDDIIALVALFRPGPLESGMVDDYINVKHGAKAEYAHPLLVPILKPTNGVILYQEQVMQIAREMALYTLGGADMLRRAMGKKKPEEMAKERDKFTAGAIENQVDEKIATYVFDLMEKFAGYGFNKSHSAAYALVAY
ncbi:MAG: DNA polymerase III subunit alpha, partial [Methylobacter sp.]|nr:DNA polymerase III subunit alpha [Methylobacter sp.]